MGRRVLLKMASSLAGHGFREAEANLGTDLGTDEEFLSKAGGDGTRFLGLQASRLSRPEHYIKFTSVLPCRARTMASLPPVSRAHVTSPTYAFSCRQVFPQRRSAHFKNQKLFGYMTHRVTRCIKGGGGHFCKRNGFLLFSVYDRRHIAISYGQREGTEASTAFCNRIKTSSLKMA